MPKLSNKKHIKKQKNKDFIFYKILQNVNNHFMKFLKDLFLYFSAFIPLFLLLVVKLVVDIINQNLTMNFLNAFNIAHLVVLIALGIVGLLWNTKFAKQKTQKIKVVETKEITDQYFLQYFSLFVLFAVPLDLSYFNEFFIYILVLVFISIVYMNCGLYYINPTLNILGYHFYDTTFLDKNGQKQTAKIFSKTPLVANQNCIVKIKNKNFAFATKKS